MPTRRGSGPTGWAFGRFPKKNLPGQKKGESPAGDGQRGGHLDHGAVAGGDAADQRGEGQHDGVVVRPDDERRPQSTALGDSLNGTDCVSKK